MSAIPESSGLFKRSTRILYYAAIVFLHYYMFRWTRSIFPGPLYIQLCFLTNMSFYLNFFYYSYVLLLHTPLRKHIQNTKLLRGFSKFAYTLSFVVFILYWGMIAADPSLLVTSKENRILPLGLDLFLHGANYVLNFIEHVYSFPKADSSHVNYTFYTGFMIFYGFLLQFVYNYSGFAVYPFVNQGLVAFSLITFIGLCLIFVGDFTHKRLLKKHHVKAY